MSGHCQSSDRNWATIGWETSRETETELWTALQKVWLQIRYQKIELPWIGEREEGFKGMCSKRWMCLEYVEILV